jgi:hypothetical protein
MHPATPNLSVNAARVPQAYVRKFRLEVREAESWEIPQHKHISLQEHVRRRAWRYAGSLMAASALLWAAWHWITP